MRVLSPQLKAQEGEAAGPTKKRATDVGKAGRDGVHTDGHQSRLRLSAPNPCPPRPAPPRSASPLWL